MILNSEFEFMILCASRYCIGRCTYAPHTFCDIVELHIDEISETTLRMILDDIQKAEPDGLGMSIDKERWLHLKNNIISRLDKIN